ncbi:2-oxoglutarate dehydrogenase E1 component [Shigella flexneri]|nr:2-oxoglutarate dehydrogenase E1 component [Shigella flexneri]
MCSGKVYYDLLEQRRKNNQHDVAIVRIEQLYPFPQHHFREVIPFGASLRYAGRPASASPAVGYMSVHQKQQQDLVNDALNVE